MNYPMRLALFCLLILPVAGRPAGAATDADPFYFAHVTDIHFGSNDHDGRMARVVRWINDLPMPIEFVAITGDVFMETTTNLQKTAAHLAILDGLQCPYYLLPGNHDVLQRNLDPFLDAYTNHVGPLLQQVHCRGVDFFFVYTEPLARDFTVAGYDPLGRLEAGLSALKGRPAVVLHHTPSCPDFYNNTLHPGWPDTNRTAWSALLNRHNVLAILAGHFHRDEHHWVGNVPLYVGGAVATYWGRTTCFRVFEYRNGRLAYRTQYFPP